MTPEGWRTRQVRQFASRSRVVNSSGELLPPLSITKGQGVVLQSDRYNKQIATDLRKYVLARCGQFAFDPMSLYYGSIGRVQHAQGLVSPDYVVFDIDETVDGDFLAYLLRWPEQVPIYEAVAETGNQFGKRRRVYWSVFEDLSFALPPLHEQRKIAGILSSVDRAIEATLAVIDQLQVVKKAVTAELLTRGIPGRHTRFKTTEIGEVPEEWEVATLAECIREPIRNGYSPVCPAIPTGRWIFHLGAVTFDGLDQWAVKPAPVGDARLDAASVEPGDVLVSRSNTRERVGLAGLYQGTPGPCFYPDLIMRVRPSPTLLPDFLEAVLLSGRGRAYMSRAARGTSESMVKINRQILEDFQIPLPTLSEQKEVVEVLAAISGRRMIECEALGALRALKAALMSVLLTGEVRVTDNSKAAE